EGGGRARAPDATGIVGGEDLAAAIVAVDVVPGQAGDLAPAIAIPAGDRAAAPGMAVVEDRQQQAGVVAGGSAGLAAGIGGAGRADRGLHPPPAPVPAAHDPGGLEIHFLARVLADVGDEEVARRPVEADAPWIADALGPFLVARAGPENRVRR